MSDELMAYPERSDIAVARNPKDVLREARLAAQCLMEVIELKPKPVKFNGETYLELEDWQTVGKFYGITAKVVQTSFVDYGGVKGFESVAEAIGPDGRILSRAESLCLNDEENWSTRPKYEYKDILDEQGNKTWIPASGSKKGYYKSEKVKVADVPVPMFQLKSMAQTRACSKVLRNVLAWVVVLAGYKTTPAEEIIGNEPGIQTAEETPAKPTMSKEALKNHEFKEITAKFDGTCKSCNKPVKKGEKVSHSPKLGVFHPACIAPEPSSAMVTTPILNSLKKLAEEAGIVLIDHIGADGYDSLESLPLEYANQLMKDLAEKIDEARTQS